METPDRGVVVERLQRQGHIVLRRSGRSASGLGELLQIELRGTRSLDKAALSEVTCELAIRLAQPGSRRSPAFCR
jgi:hypothetical protein